MKGNFYSKNLKVISKIFSLFFWNLRASFSHFRVHPFYNRYLTVYT